MSGAARAGFAAVAETHGHAALLAGDALNRGVGEDLDAFGAERFLNHGGGVRGVFAQELSAALDERDARADAVEKLSEFAGDDATAEHDHALGDVIEIEYVVARPETRFGEARNRRHADFGARAEEDVTRADGAAVGQREGMRIEETRVGADQVELARRERGFAVRGKLADDLFLPRLHRLHVGAGRGNFEAKGAALLREVEDLGHVEQRLGRHAAAQDAQPAKLLRAVHDGGFEAEADGDTRGVEAGATTADDEEIVSFGTRL